jgi:hypothetical protein
MTHDHRSTDIHRADLDREIDAIRLERLLALDGPPQAGIVGRARHGAGRVLIAAGMALLGREAGALRAHLA